MNAVRTHVSIVPALVLVALVLVGPFILGSNQIPTFIGFSLVAIFAYGWNVIGGTAGELNFGMLVSWGLGAYLVVDLLTVGVPLALVAVIALAAGALFGILLTVITTVLKLEGLVLAVFTLVVVEVAVMVANVLPYTGGPVGIRLRSDERFPVLAYHLISVIVLAALVVLTYLLLRSRRGLRWLAMREDPVAAASVGVRVSRERLVAAGLAGAIGAIGGGLQAHYLGFALADTALSIPFLLIAVLSVFAGGPGTVLGPFIGAVIMYGFALIVNPFVTGSDSGFVIRLLQYAVAFLIIRLLIVKGQGDDLATVAIRAISSRVRRSSKRQHPPVQPPFDATAPISAGSVATVRELGPELLRLDDVTKAFGGLKVLRGVAFSVRAGEFVALVGPNGAGKSTVTNLVAGVLQPDSGTISLRDEHVEGLPPATMFRRGVARTFQIPRLMPKLSLLDNVAVGCDGDREVARHALERVGVLDVDRKAAVATLFEHRMVEVARALAGRARLLLLDEPLAGLSPTQRSEVVDAIVEHIDPETGVVIIEHLIPAIAPVVDRMVVLVDGMILVDGPPSLVLHDNRVIESYLGQAGG